MQTHLQLMVLWSGTDASAGTEHVPPEPSRTGCPLPDNPEVSGNLLKQEVSGAEPAP